MSESPPVSAGQSGRPRFQDVARKLNVVRHSRDDYDLGLFPDFLIIGPQRTGTTWMHECLVEHPHVFMPEQKEIYYFNTLRFPEKHPPTLPPIDPELGWYLEHFQVDLDWAAKRDAEVRGQFGVGFEPRVRGEATATYAAALDPQIIRDVLLLNPGVKVLTMVRDPIERAWSHAKKDLSKLANRKAEDVSEAQWLEFLNRPYQVKCGNYAEIHAKWLSRMPAEQFFVGDFSRVASDPLGLLRDVCAFVGIDFDERFFAARAKVRVNPTASAPIPSRIREELERLFGAEAARLRSEGRG